MASIYKSAVGQQRIRDWCVGQLQSWHVPHDCRVVVAHGVETHVVSAGGGDVTVVYLPGTNFNAASSLPLAEVMAGRYRVVLVDVPGQPGLSDGHRDAATGSKQWCGRWLDELLAQVASGPVVVMGHSYGGAIAMSSTSPLIGGRLLVSTAGLRRLRISIPVLVAAGAWLVFPRPSTSVRLLRLMLAPDHQARPALVEWMTLVAEHCRSSGSPSSVPFRRSKTPTAVAVGAHDIFLPPAALRSVVRERFGRKLTVVPGSGHLVVEEAPQELMAVLDTVVEDMTPDYPPAP
ncbi:alpha/beta fold hydrolase [Kocuria sabuli]|uniref:alpha/beta fold hydrolase n=1 Tax=Kocuria sabuli TaxID=3071448 RepID=UPI0034D4B1E9